MANRPLQQGVGKAPKVIVRFPKAIYDELVGQARQRGVKLSVIMREATIRGLQVNERKGDSQ